MILQFARAGRLVYFMPYCEVSAIQHLRVGSYDNHVGIATINGVKRVGVVQWATSGIVGGWVRPEWFQVVEPRWEYTNDSHNLSQMSKTWELQYFYDKLLFWRELYKYALQNNANVQSLEW